MSRSEVSLNSTKTKVKSCLCLAENFACNRVTLAAQIIRKDKINETLNKKHIVLLGHDISHHSPAITRPSYNLAGNTS